MWRKRTPSSPNNAVIIIKVQSDPDLTLLLALLLLMLLFLCGGSFVCLLMLMDGACFLSFFLGQVGAVEWP